MLVKLYIHGLYYKGKDKGARMNDEAKRLEVNHTDELHILHAYWK